MGTQITMDGPNNRKLLLNCTRKQVVILVDYDEKHRVSCTRDSFIIDMPDSLLDAQ